MAGLELMERAGAGVARAVERLAPDGPVTVVCGKGNNGGDGLVVARLLRDAGGAVTVVCVAPPEELSGDARANLERLPGEPPVRLGGAAWTRAPRRARASAAAAADAFGADALVVDALLGTGFEGEPRGAVAEAIDAINAARRAGRERGRAERRRRLDRRRRGRGGARGGHRHLPRGQARAVDPPGQGARGRGAR